MSTGQTETIRRLFDELIELAPEERAERLQALDELHALLALSRIGARFA